MIGLSLPNFWLGTMLVYFLSGKRPWFPPGGYIPFSEDPLANLKAMVLPATALGLVSASVIMRMTRSSMLEIVRQDYVRTARAKGLQESAITWHHLLRWCSGSWLGAPYGVGRRIIGGGGGGLAQESRAVPAAGRYPCGALRAPVRGAGSWGGAIPHGQPRRNAPEDHFGRRPSSCLLSLVVVQLSVSVQVVVQFSVSAPGSRAEDSVHVCVGDLVIAGVVPIEEARRPRVLAIYGVEVVTWRAPMASRGRWRARPVDETGTQLSLHRVYQERGGKVPRALHVAPDIRIGNRQAPPHFLHGFAE